MLLEADRLKVRYENGALGVIDISLAVAPGQVVAMVGANGAGKSTTLRAISGFARAEGARVIDGSVRVDEREMTNREPYQYSKAGIHCIPERNKVFANLTVTENLLAIGRFGVGYDSVDVEACTQADVVVLIAAICLTVRLQRR